jgi:hypothetical protein
MRTKVRTFGMCVSYFTLVPIRLVACSFSRIAKRGHRSVVRLRAVLGAGEEYHGKLLMADPICCASLMFILDKICYQE